MSLHIVFGKKIFTLLIANAGLLTRLSLVACKYKLGHKFVTFFLLIIEMSFLEEEQSIKLSSNYQTKNTAHREASCKSKCCPLIML